MLLQSRSHKSKNLLFYNNKTFVFSTWIFKCIHFNIQFSNISTLELLELITCIIEFFYIVCCFPSHIHFIKIFIDTFTCHKSITNNKGSMMVIEVWEVCQVSSVVELETNLCEVSWRRPLLGHGH